MKNKFPDFGFKNRSKSNMKKLSFLKYSSKTFLTFRYKYVPCNLDQFNFLFLEKLDMSSGSGFSNACFEIYGKREFSFSRSIFSPIIQENKANIVHDHLL